MGSPAVRGGPNRAAPDAIPSAVSVVMDGGPHPGESAGTASDSTRFSTMPSSGAGEGLRAGPAVAQAIGSAAGLRLRIPD